MTALILVPLLALAAAAIDYAGRGTMFNLLWICNVCNVVLIAGMLRKNATLVWVATLWLIAGTPMWIMDDVLHHTFTPHAVLTHVGSAAVGLLWMRSAPAPKAVWMHAIGLAVGLLFLTHYVSPPELNVNVAHRSYFEVPFVRSHVVYVALNLGLFAGILWVMENAIKRWLPTTKRLAPSN